MIIEAVRIIDAAMRDATIGVGAYLATVPLETGDTTPTTPTILNECQSAEAARDAFPDGVGPYLLIGSGELGELVPTAQPQRDGTIEILIRYGSRAAATHDVLRAASYTIRAVRRTLSKLTTTAAGETLRLRNQVQVIDVQQLRSVRLTAPAEDVLVTWGVIVTLRTRDLWAQT